jgi:predicted GH43/DUF377 family glycosyl hydrolase
MRVAALALSVLVFSGCARYADFVVPPPQAQPHYHLDWKAAPEVNLTRGDALDVLNPSVVRHGAGYLNLYSRFDGKRWDTYAATSADGASWANARKILSPELPWEGSYIAANGGAVSFQGELLYVYQAGEKGKTILGLARSRDGVSWTKQPTPILTLGPWRSWDEVSLGDPYVWEANGVLYLCYLGEDRARRQRLGLARSTDGVHWEKQRNSPILDIGGYGDFDENGLGEAAIFASGNQWVMLYTGRDRKEHRAMGYAVSNNGRTWTKLREPVLRGSSPWNNTVVCDATVLAEPSRLRIWYGGGDKPSPDERLNGQIGYAELAAQLPAH